MRNAHEGCVHVCACLNRELKARAGGRKVPTWSSLSTQYVPLMQSGAERERRSSPYGPRRHSRREKLERRGQRLIVQGERAG